ncbi:hypothetical protein [Sorangium sp. So ce1182]|uniref:hypothetical protein n=1 Tax=Sorangium sp. So ce1182 TaxID=3133334 RepID=UPI003F62BD1E
MYVAFGRGVWISRSWGDAGTIALAAALPMPVPSGCFARAGHEGPEDAEVTSDIGEETTSGRDASGDAYVPF